MRPHILLNHENDFDYIGSLGRCSPNSSHFCPGHIVGLHILASLVLVSCGSYVLEFL